MNEIIFDSVKFRNFFSYGKKPQEITFVPGINLVMGMDHERERSNGSGKSSFLRSIPFALYGRTHRNPIKKEDIINWKNRRACEVTLNFYKNGTKYTFFRSIRPDGFEIYENDKLLPTPSDVRTYQRTVEAEILNYDFQTFMSLIFTNLNDLTPVLQLDKMRKRAFLDNIFNLQFFADLVNRANLKIKPTQEKIFALNTSIDFSSKRIDELENQNTSLRSKLNSIKTSEQELSVERDALNKLEEKRPEHKGKSIEELDLFLKNEWSTRMARLQFLEEKMNQRKALKEKLLELEKHNKALDRIKKEYGNAEEIDKTLVSLREENNRLKETMTFLTREIHGLDIEITKAKTNLINNNSRKTELEGKDICPTCGTEITGSNILEGIQHSCQTFQQTIDELLVEKKKKDRELKKAEKRNDEVEPEIKKYEKARFNFVAFSLQANKYNETKEQLDSIENYDIEAESAKLNIEYEDIINIENSKNIIRVLEERISQEGKARDDLQNLEAENTKKVAETMVEIRSTKANIIRLSEIVDYLEYLKTLCKDENAKQYAISAHIPNVNEKVNKYLAEGGMNFYIKFDNWLEATIKGPGIYNCSYESLSGGEMRSVDLALQFAFLDISRVQTGLFPDILVTDEIFDSSIDYQGLSNIMRIIKAKQIEDKSKIFLVTHREEVEIINADNIYFVEKRDGFSTITKSQAK
jgi:DNA repair exonuclease SbcCD ATPase subunit